MSIIFVPISWNQMNFDSATMAASVTFYLKNIKLFSGFFLIYLPTYIQFDDKSAIFCLFVLMIQIVIFAILKKKKGVLIFGRFFMKLVTVDCWIIFGVT